MPSPHWQPSAKLTTHLTCGAFLRMRRKLMPMQRLSLLRGRQSSNAMRFSSKKLFHPVPSTSPSITDFFMLGP